MPKFIIPGSDPPNTPSPRSSSDKVFKDFRVFKDFKVFSVLSVFSVLKVFSALSVLKVFSVLSVLSVLKVFSVLSVLKVFKVFTRRQGKNIGAAGKGVRQLLGILEVGIFLLFRCLLLLYLIIHAIRW